MADREALETVVAMQAIEKNKTTCSFFSPASPRPQGFASGPMLRLDFKQENFICSRLPQSSVGGKNDLCL
jgi:hypothetical protein